MRDELKRREALRRADPATRLLASLEGKTVAMVFTPADGSSPIALQAKIGEVDLPPGNPPAAPGADRVQ